MNNQSYEQNDYTLNYTNSGLNNRIVDVSVVKDPYNSGTSVGNTTYKIISTATHNKSDASTIIESYIRAVPLKFWEFGQDAITSNCSVRILGTQSVINGSVTYVCDNGLDCPSDPNCHIVPPNLPRQEPGGIDWWPETWAIAEYFEDQVDISKPFTGGVIDISVNSTIGPLYVEGDLEIKSSVIGASASLEGVVYVTGDLTIDGIRDFNLDLNDQVIFVENEDAIIGGSNYNQPFAEVVIDDHCTFAGSGAIFAIGDIYFAPKLLTTADEFIFIMSIEGWVNMQPTGDYYGSIAANLHVDVSPNNEITRTEGDDYWNTFYDPKPVILKILTYDIIDQ